MTSTPEQRRKVPGYSELQHEPRVTVVGAGGRGADWNLVRGGGRDQVGDASKGHFTGGEEKRKEEARKRHPGLQKKPQKETLVGSIT